MAKPKFKSAEQEHTKPRQILEREVVSTTTAIVSRCKRCGSTERSEYGNIRRKTINAMSVVWKDCQCQVCGQRRCDIFKTHIGTDMKVAS